jgi:hypothetical protein
VTYDSETGTYTLKSGRVIRANAGILGLAPDDTTLYEGYTGTYFDGQPGAEEDEDGRPYKLTSAERYEIGSEMVHRWLRWAEG